MTFSESLNSGKFVVTAEVGPPKGTDIKEMLHHMELLKGKVDAANVTDNQSAVMRICSLAVCRLLIEHGLEPILQMTCRDRNRIGIQSDLLGASILGVKNVLDTRHGLGWEPFGHVRMGDDSTGLCVFQPRFDFVIGQGEK